MALNFNIPMPQTSGQALMSGINTGGQLFSRIMNPIIQREQLAELGKYHQGTLAQQQAQMQQQQQQFLQQLALRKQAEARMAANAGIQRQVANMQLEKLRRESDPEKQMAYINQIMNGIDTTYGNQGQQGQQPQNPMSPFSGMGMPSTQEMEAPTVQPPSKDQLQQGFLSPQQRKEMALGMMGFKIPKVTETPEQKRFADLQNKIELEKWKSQNKTVSGEKLTAPIITKYQNVIGGVTSARPIIKKLIAETKKGNIPGQIIGSLFKRDAQANYKGEISTVLDGVRNAYTIPNTDSGTAKAEDKVLRKKGETDANYANRLQSILNQMDSREKDARTKLNAGTIVAEAPITVHLIGLNGEDYDVPESEVDAILKENPGVRRG